MVFKTTILNNKSICLTATIYPDGETPYYVASCVELGIASQGDSYDEAFCNLQEAIELYLTEFPEKLADISVYPERQTRMFFLENE